MSTLIPNEDLLQPAVIKFLAEVDELVQDDRVPTAATAIIQGKLILLLGKVYRLVTDPYARAEMLAHECGHFMMGHLGRQKGRDPDAWNAVIDASLHFIGVCDWQYFEDQIREVPGFERFRVNTFERLIDKDTKQALAPMPPEMAYERLNIERIIICLGGAGCAQHGGNDGLHQPGGGGCGSMKHSHTDDSIESLTKRAITAGRVIHADPEFARRLRGEIHSAGDGRGSRSIPDLPPPKPWIKKTLQWLIHSRSRSDRRRSWRRENRSFPILPGKIRLHARGGLFFLDASGSIGDDMLGEFASAVINTPELKGSEVVIFDSHWTEPIAITSVATIMKAFQEMGGGTSIRAVGQAYKDDPRPRVWITDGYSGDGWPDPHTAADVWCVWNDGPAPKHATAVVRIKPDGSSPE